MHLDADDTVALFKAGASEPHVLAHLLDCPYCRSRLRDLMDFEGGSVEPASQDVARRILERTVRKIPSDRQFTSSEETKSPTDLFAELLALPESEQDLRLQEPGFPKLGFVQFAIDQADETNEPELSFRYAKWSLELLNSLDDDATTYRLRAQALCLLAAAQRRQGLVDVANDTLVHTAELLDLAALSDPARISFCLTLATVRIDQHRTDEALALLERASALAELNGEWLDQAKARLTQGWLYLEEMDHDEALVALREALALLKAEAHPQLAFSALHALALTYADLGRQDELTKILDSLSKLLSLLPDRLHALRERWIRAQVLWRLGQTAKAINRMKRVIAGLIQDEVAVEAAMASLEVAHWGMEESPLRTRLLGDLKDALTPLALKGALAAPLWNVVAFALSFAAQAQGYYLDVLLSALRFLQKAEFNTSLPFEPLPEPGDVVSWEDIPPSARESAARAAGLELVDHRPVRIEDEAPLAWAHEGLTGERAHFLEIPAQ
jgi:tetratricopeptide (TPR) repeat protein